MLSVFAVAPAQAQTVTLVSNTGLHSSGHSAATENLVWAQGFTTGSASNGYTLSSIELARHQSATSVSSTQSTTIKAQLWSAATGGKPDSKVADLTAPSTIGAGATASFRAPSNTRLTAGTTYFVVIYTVGALDLLLSAVEDNSEHSGGQAGWSIADHPWALSNDEPGANPTWVKPHDSSLQIAVKGLVVRTAVDGTLTVGDGGSWKGFQATPSVGQLSDDDFTYVGVGYRILSLRLTNSGFLALHLNKALPREWGLVLNVGGTKFRFANAVLSTGPGHEGVIAGWGYANQGVTPPSWSVGDTVTVKLDEPTAAAVKLSVGPNPVREGSPVIVEACLPALPQGRTRIPVTLSHGTSEAGDWGVSWSGQTDGSLPIRTAESITIDDWFQSSCGSVNIPTHRDSDTEDETFTVALDVGNLPPGVQPGSPASVQVTIQDLTDLAEVTLRAVRRAVAEGSPVELQVALTKPLATDVEIPLRVTWTTSELADHGFIRSITIAAGWTTGSGTIRTHRDDDTDDERFSVAVFMPDLPSGVAPGTPSDVGITIVDGRTPACGRLT